MQRRKLGGCPMSYSRQTTRTSPQALWASNRNFEFCSESNPERLDCPRALELCLRAVAAKRAKTTDWQQSPPQPGTTTITTTTTTASQATRDRLRLASSHLIDQCSSLFCWNYPQSLIQHTTQRKQDESVHTLPYHSFKKAWHPPCWNGNSVRFFCCPCTILCGLSFSSINRLLILTYSQSLILLYI